MGLLGFRSDRSVLLTDLEHEAPFVNSLPVFIRLAGFKRHGSVANAASWKRCEVEHDMVASRPGCIIRLHRRPTPTGAAEGCVRDTASLAGRQRIARTQFNC